MLYFALLCGLCELCEKKGHTEFTELTENGKMFKKLRQKWKVSGLQLALIIITFALGGSMTGFLAKKIMNALPIHQDWLWTIIYILIVTIIWPITVVLVSFFFGQYKFFSGYVRRLGTKIGFIPEGRQTTDDRR